MTAASPRTATGRLLAPIAALVATLAACGDPRPASRDVDALATDTALARDLTLATPTVAADTFGDTATANRPADVPPPVAAAERPAPTRPAPQPSVPTRTPRAPRATPSEPTVASAPAATAPAAPAAPAPGASVPAAARPDSAALASAAARQRGAIGAGSTLLFTTTSRVCTTTNAPGDKIVATLDAPVNGSNGFTLASGTKAVLEVASVERDANRNPTAIVFRVRNLDDGTSAIPVAAEVSTADTLRRVRANADAASDRRKVVGGAAIGAVLGQVLGKDTKGTVIGAAAGGAVGAATAARGARFEGCLPQGSKITLRLTDAIVRS